MQHAIFASVDATASALSAQSYLADRPLVVAAFLAAQLEKPLLLEGPAGTGKTELAKALAAATGAPLQRLQCYEGLDESRALYEWDYGKQLLYTQLLRDTVARSTEGLGLAAAMDALATDEHAFFSRRFLLPRPLLRALTDDPTPVLLVDEVDRADEEFEAFLLEVLSDFQVTVPELGTIRATVRPLVVLTSNATRDLSDALRRRCLYAHVGYPDERREAAILAARVPGLGESLARDVAAFVARVRSLDLARRPSVAESVDWAAALVVMNADRLAPAVVRDTLGALLKDPKDVERALALRP